ncbi:biosynthetic-type acetolactate synthase large subunit [Butyrivibrio sp. XB500-5]|uniref:biosynthetic-type acetolactate synthase large subunit n=1 Tax=Butyrivibrio sp. XB500-5 TaxID=2364880 RepID=UPI000EAAAFDF|nr:biosynthetic-type acetolactate synthase large subunit [Butyrivibrio sp. XB500-5]RKM59004.1 biosynthetic-type acetolactate synthase large subunit [Butyrivibrio sp. XB500-5]
MIGAEAIVKCLEKEKTEYVFGYSGVAIDPFWNKILDTNIKSVLIRTEQNAAHCASGFARISGKTGVCAVTSGPGATNLITGIATAYADSIPLVCITGQVNSDMIGSDVFQEADITGAVESFVKYSYLVRDVADIPRIFKEAFYIASTGRKGPVLIDIPFDIQNAEFPGKFVYPETISMRTYKPTVKGNMVQIKKVIKEVEKAKKPIICVGGGVHLSNATKELRQFAELNNVPVVSTMMGIGVMPTEHPLYFGMVGNNGQSYANKAMNESDLLLMVGARVADRAVNRPDLITENKVMVHIDVDPAEIGKNVGPTIPLVGDIKHIFQDFLEQDDHADDHSEWIATINEYKEAALSKAKKSVKKKAYVEPKEFITKLSGAMKNDAVYVADVGQNQMWSCAYHIVKNGRFITSGGMGTMGYSIPAALGAKLASPKKQIVAVTGDGAFQMSMMELATMRQYGVAVKIVVMKNGYLGMVREHQHFAYNDNYSMVELKGDPDLSLIAAAYGMGYAKVDGSSNLEKELKSFLSDDSSALMEVIVDPKALTK